MSKIAKISNEIKNFVARRKKNNPDLSCRFLASEVKSRFKVNISKSSINSLLKNSLLSSPIGRRVSQVFRSQAKVDGAGYAFLYGSNLALGLSKILASCIKKAMPSLSLKMGTVETISEAWIMSKAIYNVPLQKIENYDKNELWSIIGRKANKGLLKQYIETLKVLQAINYQLVSEISSILQDVHYLRIIMADGSQYCLDGQLKTIWREPTIPIDFSVTLDLANSYINKIFLGKTPLLVNYARPQTMLDQDLSDFIFSLDSSCASKRIRKIELISPSGSVIKEASFIVPERRTFLIGIWPWQYKPISELEKQPSVGSFFLEPLGTVYYFLEDQIKFSQHIDNKEVTLRLILIKISEKGPARIGILTNLKPEDWDTQRIVEEYVRRCPNFEASQKLFLEATQAPGYREEFISAQKILNEAKKLNESRDPDVFFTILVELINLVSQRSFFPSSCSGWSLLKMREFVYKQPGLVKRDLSEDILFNLFDSNKLGDKDLIRVINFAAVKFNETPIYDFSGRKLWITTS